MVDEAIVAKFMLAHFAFVDGTEPLVITLVALVLFFAVGLEKNKFGIRIIIWDCAIKLFDAHFVETALFVNEGSAFLVFE